jgi:hypothetical protein
MAVKKRGKKRETTKETSKKSSRSTKTSKTSLRDRAKEQIKESKKKGFTAMREAKKEYSNNTKWMSFYVVKGETKPIIFATDDPVTVRTHNVKQYSRSGKEFYREILCTQDDDCKGCAEAKSGNKAVSNPRTSGVMLIIDVEGYEKDNEEIPFVVRPLMVNPTLSSVLEHRDNKEGLMLTAYDMSKLDRGHSLDVIRDKKDKIQRFDSVEDLIEYIEEENETTAKLLTEKLEEYGDLRDWLAEEIVPEFLDPEQITLEGSSGGDKEDEDESTSYSFGKKRGKGKDKKRRSRLR